MPLYFTGDEFPGEGKTIYRAKNQDDEAVVVHVTDEAGQDFSFGIIQLVASDMYDADPKALVRVTTTDLKNAGY